MVSSKNKAPASRIAQPLNSLTSCSFLIPSNSFGSLTAGISCTLGGTIGFPPFTLSSFFTGSEKLSLHCDLFSASSSPPADGFFPRFRRKHQIDRVRRASTAATTPALTPALTPTLMLLVVGFEVVFDDEEAVVPERSWLG
jgi:hypothetical protein